MRKNYIGLDKQHTKNLLVLCYAIDFFDKFDEELSKLITDENSERIINKIIDKTDGKLCLLSKKEKNFYKRNEFIINIINNFGNLSTFLWENYSTGIINTHDGLIKFTEYVKKNKDKLDTIRDVLEKIDDLGFERIIFDENLDFTKETYTISKYLQENLEVVYLDNLEAIPTYNPKLVKYKTKYSNYQINLAINNDKINPNNIYNVIALNSLIFNPKRLPDTIYQTDTYDKILELTLTVSKENEIVKDAIDLAISVEDLETVYEHINNKIKNINNVKNKEELISLLNHIKHILDNMRYISEKNNKEVVSEYTNITNEILKEEHKIYQKRRIK